MYYSYSDNWFKGMWRGKKVVKCSIEYIRRDVLLDWMGQVERTESRVEGGESRSACRKQHNINTGRRTRCYSGRVTGVTVKKGAFKDLWTRRLQVVWATGRTPMTWLGNGGNLLVAAYGPHQVPTLGCYLPGGAAREASFYMLIIHAYLRSPAMEPFWSPPWLSTWGAAWPRTQSLPTSTGGGFQICTYHTLPVICGFVFFFFINIGSSLMCQSLKLEWLNYGPVPIRGPLRFLTWDAKLEEIILLEEGIK